MSTCTLGRPLEHTAAGGCLPMPCQCFTAWDARLCRMPAGAARTNFGIMTFQPHLATSILETGAPSRDAAPIRIVLADDHPVVRRSMRLLLEREEDVEVVAEASDLSTVVRQVYRFRPHVLVLDLRFPTGSSIDTIRELRVQLPRTEIVVLTMEESPLFARQAIDAGAVGFVLTDRADSELLTAIRCAGRGDEFVSARVAARLEALLSSARRASQPARDRAVAAIRTQSQACGDRGQASLFQANGRRTPGPDPS